MRTHFAFLCLKQAGALLLYLLMLDPYAHMVPTQYSPSEHVQVISAELGKLLTPAAFAQHGQAEHCADHGEAV